MAYAAPMFDVATTPPPIAISLKKDAASAVPPDRIELQIAVPSTRQCESLQGEEIVVCATDSAAYRLGPVAAAPNEPIPKAELKLSGNTTIGAQLQTGSLGNTPANRAMVTVKVAF